ncbi:MAG: 4-hydroxythreonine-4-phosphate dehydrogenase PdxA, partial [Pseudomonadota bacterium]
MAQSCASKPLAVTMGEPAGIGAEILLKAWSEDQHHSHQLPLLYVIDQKDRLCTLNSALGLGVSCVAIDDPSEVWEAAKHGLPVLTPTGWDDDAIAQVQLGTPTPATAEAVLESIRIGVEHTVAGQAAGLVTLPIQKSVLQEAGFAFPGHTEFLGHLTEDEPLEGDMPRGPIMMLGTETFKTVPVTVHRPLSEVPAALTHDLIVKTGLITAKSLEHHFGLANPRLAVAGLNPHAGEEGRIGHEDRAIIQPAVENLLAAGIDAVGPLPADTMFHEEARERYDAALCMYHDQALIPIKTI